MHRIWRVGPGVADSGALEDTEHLQHPDASRARRPHRAQPPAPEGAAVRLALDRTVGSEVVPAQSPGPAAGAHRAHDVVCDRATIERVRAAARYLAQRRAVGAIAQAASRRLGGAGFVEEDAARLGIVAQEALARELGLQERREE